MADFIITGPTELKRFLPWSRDLRNGMYLHDEHVGKRLTREQAVFMILCYLKRGARGSVTRIEFRSYENESYNKYELVLLPEKELTSYLEINNRNTVDLLFLSIYAKMKAHTYLG